MILKEDTTLHLSISEPTDDKIEAKLLDMNGRVLKIVKFENYTNEVVSMNLSDLPKADYLLKVNVNNRNDVKTFKILKQ